MTFQGRKSRTHRYPTPVPSGETPGIKRKRDKETSTNSISEKEEKRVDIEASREERSANAFKKKGGREREEGISTPDPKRKNNFKGLRENGGPKKIFSGICVSRSDQFNKKKRSSA